jgi:hypothetical protein
MYKGPRNYIVLAAIVHMKGGYLILDLKIMHENIVCNRRECLCCKNEQSNGIIFRIQRSECLLMKNVTL